MFWDGLLIVVLAYNILRSSRRGGRAVGIELAAFSLTYAATIFVAPLLARAVRSHLESPPPFLSMLSILAVFLVARRILRATFHLYLLPPLREQWKCKPQSSRSKALGASLGVLRGAVVAVAVALMGFNVGILQHAGHLRSLPPAGESGAIRQAEAIMDLLVGRYTRDTGPTTRLLVDWTLHPEPAKFEALLNGPFADRVKSSDELRALVGNREFKALVDGRRTAEMVTHPAFLRVVSFAVRELRNEESMGY